MLAARRAGLDPLIAITTNSAARYPGDGNPSDPANPTANQYFCGFSALVSTLGAFAASQGIAPPTEFETYDEPDGARVSNECNPTPIGAASTVIEATSRAPATSSTTLAIASPLLTLVTLPLS